MRKRNIYSPRRNVIGTKNIQELKAEGKRAEKICSFHNWYHRRAAGKVTGVSEGKVTGVSEGKVTEGKRTHDKSCKFSKKISTVKNTQKDE